MDIDPNKNTVISHANCPDGMGAIFAFYLKHKNSINYVRINHNSEKFKGLDVSNLKNKRVWMVDISLARTDLLELYELTNKKLLVLDHHLTAQKDLEGLEFCKFDMNKSGAVLAYEYIFPEEKVPMLFQHIQDRDLWKFEIQNSKEFLAALDVTPATFKDWSAFYKESLTKDGYKDIVSRGKYILLSNQSLQNRIMERTYYINSKGFENIPIVNTPIFASEILSRLCENAAFALSYTYTGEKYIFSVRSCEGTSFTAREYAELFGGGGHKHAAGFSIKNMDELK